MMGHDMITTRKPWKQTQGTARRLAGNRRTSAEVSWQFRNKVGGADLRVIPGGNQVDGLPPATSATKVKEPGLRPNMYVAGQVFDRDVLAIHLSDLHQIAMGHTRHAKESFPRSS